MGWEYTRGRGQETVLAVTRTESVQSVSASDA